jgi:hypothetical protein
MKNKSWIWTERGSEIESTAFALKTLLSCISHSEESEREREREREREIKTENDGEREIRFLPSVPLYTMHTIDMMRLNFSPSALSNLLSLYSLEQPGTASFKI